MKTLHRPFLMFFSLLFSAQILFAANSPAFEQRRTNYIDTALTSLNLDAIVLQAYRGIPVDTARLNTVVRGLPTRSTVDFDLVKLMRILILGNGAYDAAVLPGMLALPYWVNKGDTLHGYWSENHMIMWMSTDWLLHEYYNKPIDATLRQRIVHYLRLKNTYGFYEFFSSTYAPYCMSGLINLADFSQDAEIKALATSATQKLLNDILKLTNNKGVFFPIAGRNYPGKYESAYGQNHNSLIYLLTGLGEVPRGASHGGSFLASTNVPLDTVSNTYTEDLDVTYYNGQPLAQAIQTHDTLDSEVDKIMFLWSSGAYFHPLTAPRSIDLLFDSVLWEHVDFHQFRDFSQFPRPTIVDLCNTLTSASMSTVISGAQFYLYKRGQVTLASLRDFWKGKVGFQQHPCVANVGTTAVYLGTGKIKQDWTTRDADNANDHLPMVAQKHNVALLMYRPEAKASILPFQFPDVALHFKDSDFDEVRENGPWLLGKQDQGYVAIRRHCNDTINQTHACIWDGTQSWVIVVGDSVSYGGFNQFESKVQQAQFSENWYVDQGQSYYYASITFDTVQVDYAWGVDTALAAGTGAIAAEALPLYPNPASDQVQLDLSAMEGLTEVKIINLQGQMVFRQTFTGGEIQTLSTRTFTAGMYTLQVSNRENLRQSKLLIQR